MTLIQIPASTRTLVWTVTIILETNLIPESRVFRWSTSTAGLFTVTPKQKTTFNSFSKKFNVAVSETWLSDDKELQNWLEGYEMFGQNRVDKRDGGVALFVMSGLKCKVTGDTILEPIGCICCLTSGRQRYSLWGQTSLFLGFCWRRRISISDFLLSFNSF